MFKSGFIAIIGEPNVGKSTFLNQVLKKKIAITSDKPQTTRDVFAGIFNDSESQLVFLDTPGIHNAKTKLGEYMTSSAISTIKAVDLVLFFVNAYDDVKESNLKIMDKLENIKTPVFLIINKLDTITDFQRLEAAIKPYKDKCAFAGVFAVSALTGQYVDLLMKDIKNMLPEGPKYYPDGALSDRPETFLIQEFIREKILDNTREEVPHAVAVYIERMQHKKELTRIDATIVVERDSQKAIVIGKNGARLKKIGTDARLDIEELLGRSVYLDLFCKVEPNWRNRDHYLKTYGYKPEKK
ncbi:MAG TPA: GTPase Era [Bacillota bacterium]|nr:GTPase Era [Bacillota bacterium]HPF42759.1 GTPase Era [Bacillota bacterium]HPJ85975.1 GTPase Era [Bacillota bacterium]HPQ62004.1 GTPase Era [Bacillota bacterium]